MLCELVSDKGAEAVPGNPIAANTEKNQFVPGTTHVCNADTEKMSQLLAGRMLSLVYIVHR